MDCYICVNVKNYLLNKVIFLVWHISTTFKRIWLTAFPLVLGASVNWHINRSGHGLGLFRRPAIDWIDSDLLSTGPDNALAYVSWKYKKIALALMCQVKGAVTLWCSQGRLYLSCNIFFNLKQIFFFFLCCLDVALILELVATLRDRLGVLIKI